MKKKPNKRVKIRKTWSINPKTRVKESKKVYKRARLKQALGKKLKEVK